MCWRGPGGWPTSAYVTPHPDRDEGLSYAALLAAIAAGFVPVAIATGLSKVEITRLAALVAPRLIVHDPGMSLPDHPAPVLMADTIAWSRPAPESTTGFVQTGRHVICLGDAGEPVPFGAAGDLAVLVDDPGFMRGYLGTPVPPGLPPDPWCRTGDLVNIAESGAMTHLGREDDLITAGGFRSAGQEIEAAFHDLPDLLVHAKTEVKVTPGTRNHRAVFWDVCRALPLTSASARRDCACPLETAKAQPSRLPLPRSPNGKLVRRALADRFTRASP